MDLGGTKPKRPHRSSRVKERIVHQDDGEGNWLMSYADMMTLLFAFFVIMAAFSTPDASKMERLKQETAKSMGVEYQRPFEDMTDTVRKVLKDFKLDQEISVVETTDGVAITSKGTLFFDSGSADLKGQAQDLIEKLSQILVVQAKGFRILVEGHTDDVPIVSARFPSNWELSAGRASTVVRLLESKGFPHNDLRPLGLADTEPVVPNLDSEGKPNNENRAQNRRIVIRIQKQLPKRMSNSKVSAAPGSQTTDKTP